MLDFSRQTTAKGLLAQLSDPNRDIQVYSLKKLEDIVNYTWHEISDYVP